jgi:hypothetical protein
VTRGAPLEDESLVFWTRVVWSYAKMPAPSRFLLLSLAYLVNPAGNVTAPRGLLAELMNVNVRTVATALRTCERRGWIVIRPEPSRRQGAREGLTYQLLTNRERKSS